MFISSVPCGQFLGYTGDRTRCLSVGVKKTHHHPSCCHGHAQLLPCRQLSGLAEQFQAASDARRQAVNVQTVFRTQEEDPVSSTNLWNIG